MTLAQGRLVPPGGYNNSPAEHEGPPFGGHTKTLHVAKQLSFLKQRLNDTGHKDITSFRSLREAEVLISRVLNDNWAGLHAWLQHPDSPLGYELSSRDMGKETGYGYTRGTRKRKVARGIYIALIKTPKKKEGFQIFTAFPIF
ncbi:MAG: RNase A-like domain-containing protein [Pseudomonadota bacterium]